MWNIKRLNFEPPLTGDSSFFYFRTNQVGRFKHKVMVVSFAKNRNITKTQSKIFEGYNSLTLNYSTKWVQTVIALGY